MESSLDGVERRAFYFEPQRATTASCSAAKTSRTAARHATPSPSSPLFYVAAIDSSPSRSHWPHYGSSNLAHVTTL